MNQNEITELIQQNHPLMATNIPLLDGEYASAFVGVSQHIRMTAACYNHDEAIEIAKQQNGFSTDEEAETFLQGMLDNLDHEPRRPILIRIEE